MKKIIFIPFLIASLLFTSFQITYANCWGALTNGVSTWTVASNCTVSNGLYSIWNDVIVWARTVTVASNAALLLDWNNNKMTFTTGKVLLQWNGTLYGEHSEFTWYNPDTPTGTAVTSGSFTNCPSWKTAWNPIVNWNATTPVKASRRWYIPCK